MKRPPALRLYRLGTFLLQPIAWPLLRARARRGKEDVARLPERQGHASAPRPRGPLIWLHGASVGEGLSLLPLVDALRAARPEATLLVTSTTITSATLLAKRLPRGVLHQFAPVDAPRAVRRFLDHWRPDLAVFVESELWPNILVEATARGVRLALVSARLSSGSLRGWSRAPGSAAALLGAFDLVLPQDDEIALRLSRVGARDDGRLNLKFAGAPLPADPDRLAQLRAATKGRPVLLAASTHPGEDEIVLEAFGALPLRALGPILVIVPRHPARGPEVAALAGGDLQSRGDRFGEARVYVADTLGQLGLWFRLADGALIGGSLSPGVGGHNPLEPARLDRPLASGPHVDNWRGVYQMLERAGGVREVATADDIARFWTDALDGALAGQVAAARAVTEGQSGELDGAVAQLLALLP